MLGGTLGSTTSSMGETRKTTSSKFMTSLGHSSLPHTPKGGLVSTHNMSCVILETGNVTQRHVSVGESLKIDQEHLGGANNDLRDCRDEIKLRSKRLQKNTEVIAMYEKDIVPLLTAYEKATEGFKKTYESARVGHEKGECGPFPLNLIMPPGSHPLPTPHAPQPPHSQALNTSRRRLGTTQFTPRLARTSSLGCRTVQGH